MSADNQTTTVSVEEFLAALAQLDENTRQLQSALMKHEVNALWELAARQEQLLDRIGAMQAQPALRAQLSPEEISKAKALAMRVKTTQRLNSVLTRTFMRIIDAALSAVSNPHGHAAMTYNPSGGFQPQAAPLFVQQVG